MKNGFILASLVIILVVGFVIVEAAIPPRRTTLLSNQDGLFLWSSSANAYLKVSTVVESMQTSHNSLFKRLYELEIRVKVLEEN